MVSDKLSIIVGFKSVNLEELQISGILWNQGRNWDTLPYDIYNKVLIS